MVKNKTTFDKLFLILIAMITILFSSFSTISATAFASETEYSSVMEDLSKVDDFNKAKYPYVEKDHSINVIQIAESEAKQLFVYTYQPTGQAKQLKATTVRIATSTGDDKSYHDYQLTLLNSNGVFFKYLVNGLEVKNDTTRYYDIPAIHRKYIEGVDTPPSEGQTSDEVAFEVGALWTAETKDGKVVYNCTASETIEIIDKHVGFLRYLNGFYWWSDYTDSHYIAFNTDKPIDNLLEAEIEYKSQQMQMHKALITGNITYYPQGEKQSYSTKITETDVMTNDPYWLAGYSYVRNRVQTVDEFSKDENLTEEAKEDIKGKQWVLRFAETKYDYDVNGYYYYTDISEVTILRLKFKTNNVTYNLGVVDNKQTGSSTPDNKQFDFWEWLKETFGSIIGGIIAILAIIVATIVFLPLILAFILTLPSKIYKELKKNKGR